MKRTELLAALKQVEPALSAKDIIPVFTCFCFDGERVTAYDDIVALQAPLEDEFTGALRGRVLLDFLKASKAKEVDLITGEDEITVKAGRSKLKLGVIPQDDFLFEYPEDDPEEITIDIDEDFVHAVGACSVSLGLDPSHSWRMGITLSFTDNSIDFYSSDNMTATMSSIEMEMPGELVGHSIILPPRFCELLASIGHSEGIKTLHMTDDWVAAVFNNDVRLFSKTINAVDLEKYGALFNSMADPKTLKKAIKIPRGMDRCFERTLVVLSQTKDKVTKVDIKDGRMKFETVTDLGDVRDVLPLKTNHQDVSFYVVPDLVRRVLPFSSKFLAPSSRCMVFSGDGFTHLISLVARDSK